MAEYAVAGILHFAKGLHRAAVDREAAAFAHRAYRPLLLEGKTTCVVGVGGIGREVGRLCAALGMRVLGTRRHPQPGLPLPPGFSELGGPGDLWPSFGGTDNPYRELDLAEISRWGFDQTTGNCPYSGQNGQFYNQILCKGNAQFAIQDFTKSKVSVQRYDIGSYTAITLVMQWRPGIVTYLKYDTDNIHLNNLPSAPAATWTKDSQVPNNAPVPNDPNFKIATPLELAPFIPNPITVTPNPPSTPRPLRSCARFHLNIWLGNFPQQTGGSNPGPTNGLKQEAVITNFEYKPLIPTLLR
jgi:D-isomer specific 2-hydroxyacid dehydrogenase, NAD binding domain